MKRALVLALAIVSSAEAADVVVGGTLHGATLRDWRAASSANQLATVADIIEKFLNLRDPLAVAPKARAVQSCVSRVAANFTRGAQTVADTSIACMAELGYLQR